MPKIFISYRRSDSQIHAMLIYERLQQEFGADEVFMDVADIAGGDVWKQVLERRVAGCDARLAVIGPGWLTARNAAKQRRIDAEDDVVRQEIDAALSGGKRVIPVLVDGGSLPGKQDLPPALAALAGLQAKTVTAAKFDQDMEDLVNAILGRPPRGAGGWLVPLGAAMGRRSFAGARPG